MSYCQVEIGGKLRGLKFNNYALHLMQQKIDIDAPELTAAYAMVYSGLRGNCYVKGEQPDFTFEDVVTWVDNIDETASNLIAYAFSESEAYKKTTAYLESKKNVQPIVEDMQPTSTDATA